MKRFLILFVLIVFSVVSCAGPTKVGSKVGRWTKSDLSQDQFNKDREECIQSIEKEASEQETIKMWGQADIEECLAKKGYTFKPPPADKNQKDPMTIGKVLLIMAITPVAFAIMVVGCIQALAYL